VRVKSMQRMPHTHRQRRRCAHLQPDVPHVCLADRQLGHAAFKGEVDDLGGSRGRGGGRGEHVNPSQLIFSSTFVSSATTPPAQTAPAQTGLQPRHFHNSQGPRRRPHLPQDAAVAVPAVDALHRLAKAHKVERAAGEAAERVLVSFEGGRGWEVG
jgi:hypothetical protein